MKNKLMYYFEGTIPLEDITTNEKYNEDSIFERLIRSSDEIKLAIEKDLSRKIELDVEVEINFEKGSIDWNGIVKIIWDTIEVLSTVGGAIAFIQIISSTVNKVLKKHIPTKSNKNINTKVYPLYKSRKNIKLNKRDRYFLLLSVLFSSMSFIALFVIIYLLLFNK